MTARCETPTTSAAPSSPPPRCSASRPPPLRPRERRRRIAGCSGSHPPRCSSGQAAGQRPAAAGHEHDPAHVRRDRLRRAASPGSRRRPRLRPGARRPARRRSIAAARRQALHAGARRPAQPAAALAAHASELWVAPMGVVIQGIPAASSRRRRQHGLPAHRHVSARAPGWPPRRALRQPDRRAGRQADVALHRDRAQYGHDVRPAGRGDDDLRRSGRAVSRASFKGDLVRRARSARSP